MARKKKKKIDTSRFRTPTQEELDRAKEFVLRRSEMATEMRQVATEEIAQAAEEIAQIAMRYDIPATQFAIDSSVNEEMMDEVTAVMEALEDSLAEEVLSYAIPPIEGDENEGIRALLIAFLMSIGHRNLGLRETLHQYLWRSLRQTEAVIAAAKAAGRSSIDAARQAHSAIMGSFTTDRDYNAIRKYRHLYNAQYIRNGGQATFPDGTPNVSGVPVNGALAAARVLGAAVDRTWERYHTIEMEQNGAIGYWQYRGSDYPCDICDEEVGFHPLGDMEYDDFPQPNCYCGRIPIYNKEEINNF